MPMLDVWAAALLHASGQSPRFPVLPPEAPPPRRRRRRGLRRLLVRLRRAARAYAPQRAKSADSACA